MIVSLKVDKIKTICPNLVSYSLVAQESDLVSRCVEPATQLDTAVYRAVHSNADIGNARHLCPVDEIVWRQSSHKYNGVLVSCGEQVMD